MNIKTVGVVGAGTMGNGIGQVCAMAGLKVIIQDIGETHIQAGLDTITSSLKRMVKKEKMSKIEMQTTLANIQTTTSLDALVETDIVIEAASEDEVLKLGIFKQLDQICKTETILASNTSSISLTRIAGVTQRSERVIGMHFMNPVPMMTLVEIIPALQTSDVVYQVVHNLTMTIGKTPIRVKDSPGFVANRILMPMINEAVFTLYEGIATAKDIDEIMKLGMAHPMGPLALADLIGLDTCLSVIKVLYQDFGDSKYRPCPLLQQMVDAGYLGHKSGRGFYIYDG
jgi:3-hydroxybutyryl-CoA dehydrogenase